MPSLNRLPFEILSDILSHLTRRDLIVACRVSRNLQVVAESVLYRAPYLTPATVRWLLRTLLTPGRGILATYVLELTLGLIPSWYLDLEADEPYDSEDDTFSEWDTGSLDEEFGGAISDSDEEECSAEAPPAIFDKRNLSVREVNPAAQQCENEMFTAARFRFRLGDPSPCVHFLLLLHLLPHLQRLTISSRSSGPRFMELLKAVPVSELPIGLQSLRHFSSREQGVSSAIFCTILQLPNILTVDVRLRHEDSDLPEDYDSDSSASPELDSPNPSPWTVEDFLPLVGVTSTVAVLKLHNTPLDSASLALIFSTPRALRILSYECDPSAPTSILPDVGRAILPTQNSLQELTLACGSTAIGSLRDWPKLHTVRCSLGTLLGDPDTPLLLEEILPVRIKELDILYGGDWSGRETIDVVMRLLGKMHAVLPRLESIGVLRDVEKGKELGQMLEVACLKADVEMLDDYPTRPWW